MEVSMLSYFGLRYLKLNGDGLSYFRQNHFRVTRSWLYLGFLLLTNVQPALGHNNHICAYSNESVVKFRKNLVGENPREALRICMADKIVGKNSIFFEWPVDLCDFWVSSLFGPRTHRGVTKMHEGVDLAAFKGTAVKAAASGVVVRADSNVPGYGTLVEISHSKGFKTRYGHLDEILIQVGDKINRGDLIGTVGATGRVRGKKDPSHLHFEILHHGTKVNPLKYLYCGEVAFTSK